MRVEAPKLVVHNSSIDCIYPKKQLGPSNKRGVATLYFAGSSELMMMMMIMMMMMMMMMMIMMIMIIIMLMIIHDVCLVAHVFHAITFNAMPSHAKESWKPYGKKPLSAKATPQDSGNFHGLAISLPH